MNRKGRTNCVAPTVTWSYAFWLLPSGLCEIYMYIPRVNTPDKLRTWVTTAIADVTKNMQKPVW
jgi:hypothetical protein